MPSSPANTALRQAHGLMQRQQFGKAAETLRSALETDPQNFQALNMLGSALSKMQRFHEAADAWEQALKLQAGQPDVPYNLALTYRRIGRSEEAGDQLKRLLQTHPDYTAAWTLLGLIQQDQEDYENALKSYDRCLALDSSSVIALHNKAIILRIQKKYRSALKLSQEALKLAPRLGDIHQNLGSCLAALGEPEKAINAYRQAVRLEPMKNAHHHWLNQLLWIEGRDDFLDSYRQVIRTAPDAHSLRRDLVYKLMQAGRLEQALEQSTFLIEQDRETPLNHQLHGGVQRKLKMFGEAVQSHQQAAGMEPTNLMFKEELATSLLASGDASAAMPLIAELRVAAPLHQGYIALLATGLRILGSDEYHHLYDYERLVLRTKIETPPGFASLEEFNRDLKSHLTDLHITKQHPLDQSLVGGTQTIDDLFVDAHELVRLLKAAFDNATSRFLQRLPVDPGHPTLSRNTHNFRSTGAWSVLLRSSGFHRNHYHSHGWFSGPYYVDLPGAVNDEVQKQGWIKFGEPSFDCAVPLPPDLVVKPEPGLMVRFPSYMWHGTIPFQTEETRLVVSLDFEPA